MESNWRISPCIEFFCRFKTTARRKASTPGRKKKPGPLSRPGFFAAQDGSRPASIHLDLRVADDFGPLAQLGFHHPVKLLRGGDHGVAALLKMIQLHCGMREHVIVIL